MIIKPKVRGFVCITAHPTGCARHVREQVEYVTKKGKLDHPPRRVLIIGCSTGYGLASRIVSAFAGGAATLGVCFEKPSDGGKPASAGWYNTAAFHRLAREAGLWAATINGDAFSDHIKAETVQTIQKHLGQVDWVVYSLASPRRTDPLTGITYKSVLKPIGQPFRGKTLDTDRRQVIPVEIEPATQEEIQGTVKVMGGEDWALWIQALSQAKVLAEGVRTMAYDYVGPALTWPIYRDGTIGRAKLHLKDTADRLQQQLQAIGGSAFLSVNKAVVTQASSAIPVVPLYISILFKVMKERGLHEGCIEQIDRLFRTRLLGGHLATDESGKIRIDDWEMRPEIQQEVELRWPRVTTETLDQEADFAGYQEEFLKLFGFGLAGVDYEAEVGLEAEW